MEIFIALLSLAIGIFIGYRIGVVFIRRENESLHKQLHLHERYSQYWGAESAGRNELYSTLRQQQTSNLSATMNTVVQLLHSLQQQDHSSLSSEDQKRVENILSQAKLITPTNGVH